jgi:hypothetical protein
MTGGNPYIFWIIGLVIALCICLLVWQRERLLKSYTAALATKNKALATRDAEYAKLVARMEGLQKIIEQRKVQFPWLASAIADFHALEAERDANLLQRKRHPAVRAAQQVREHGRKRRDAEVAARLMRYRVEYYEKIFPWIADFVGDDVPDDAIDLSGSAAEPTDDPAKIWLSDAEYQNLSAVEKNQLALDRWRTSPKTNWQVGRDYERFIGYNYETLGYDVAFTGAVEGLQDMGRDLIARRGSELRVIQCKYWSQNKTIHEKHIFQLFGSALEYAFRLGTFGDVNQLSMFGGPINVSGVKAVLYTSTKISDVAKEAAKKLNVECNANIRISDYPLVKCNISQRDGQRIYHLPFDQQYDRTKIKPDNGEKYVYTVAEAEQEGFRRAGKWRPDRI